MLSIIPITNAPNQTFNCKIPIDSKNLIIHFSARFNEVAQYWVVSLSDNKGEYYIKNLPIVPCSNILEQLSYMEIGSAYIIKSEALEEEYPSASTLGTEWILVWSDTYAATT